jgi:hypothetical protein
MAPPRNPLAAFPRRILDWLCDGRADYREFRHRRATKAYRANRAICLGVWLVGAGLMLVCGGGGCLLTILLVATLICFALLDPD